MAVLLLDVVLALNALTPTPTFCVPVVFCHNALCPKPELSFAVVLLYNACCPKPQLLEPLVFPPKLASPTAVFHAPVFAVNAYEPTAVL